MCAKRWRYVIVRCDGEAGRGRCEDYMMHVVIYEKLLKHHNICKVTNCSSLTACVPFHISPLTF